MTTLPSITDDQTRNPWREPGEGATPPGRTVEQPDADTHRVRLHLLGGFACTTAGRDVELPIGAQQLLAFLALHGPSTRCAVAGSLWPEVTDAHALASLRTRVWRLRKTVPGAVDTHGQLVTLGTGTWVDSQAQERLAASLLHHTLRDSPLLCTDLPLLRSGELLPGWYDDWVSIARERLRQLRLQALEVAVELLLDQQETDVALDLALQAVQAEPLRESAHAALIRVHLATGNAAEARRQFGVCSALLERELGLAPSARLTRVLLAR